MDQVILSSENDKRTFGSLFLHLKDFKVEFSSGERSARRMEGKRDQRSEEKKERKGDKDSAQGPGGCSDCSAARLKGVLGGGYRSVEAEQRSNYQPFLANSWWLVIIICRERHAIGEQHRVPTIYIPGA